MFKRGDLLFWKPSGKVSRWYLDKEGECRCVVVSGPYSYQKKAATYKVVVFGVMDSHGSSFQLFAKADDLRPTGKGGIDINEMLTLQREIGLKRKDAPK